jgi:hypothetical protein
MRRSGRNAASSPRHPRLCRMRPAGTAAIWLSGSRFYDVPSSAPAFGSRSDRSWSCDRSRASAPRCRSVCRKPRTLRRSVPAFSHLHTIACVPLTHQSQQVDSRLSHLGSFLLNGVSVRSQSPVARSRSSARFGRSPHRGLLPQLETAHWVTRAEKCRSRRRGWQSPAWVPFPTRQRQEHPRPYHLPG